MSQIVVKVIQNYSYQTNNSLGQGVYGKVYLGADRTTGQKVAIKKIQTVIFTQDKYLEGAIYSQIRLLKRFSHPNIIKFIDVLNSKHNLYIVTEFCKDGDLKQMIKKRKRIPEEQAFGIITQVLNGFTQLVDEKIIHRDLKPANILVNNGVYKIADFGFARYVDNFGTQMLKSLVGSPIYMAPQILERNDYTTKCDIWSIGVIFYEMIFGRHPWTGRDENDLLRSIQNISVNSLIRRQNISAKASDFLKKCLGYSEGSRFTWNELFETYLYKNEKEIPKPLQFQADKYSVNQNYKSSNRVNIIAPSKSSSFSNSNNSNTTTASSSNNPQSPNSYQAIKETTSQNTTNNQIQPNHYTPTLGSVSSLSSKESTTSYPSQNASYTYGGYNSYNSHNQNQNNQSYTNLNRTQNNQTNLSNYGNTNVINNTSSNQINQNNQSVSQPSQNSQTSPTTYTYNNPNTNTNTNTFQYNTTSPSSTQPVQQSTSTSNIRNTTNVNPLQTQTSAKSQSYGLSIDSIKAGRQVIVVKYQLLEKLLKIGRADCLDVHSWQKLLFVLAQFSKVKSIYLSSLLNILVRSNKNLQQYSKTTQKQYKQYQDTQKHIIQNSTCISKIKQQINMIGFKSQIINEDRIKKLQKNSCEIATSFMEILMEDLKRKQSDQSVQLLEIMIKIIESESEGKPENNPQSKLIL